MTITRARCAPRSLAERTEGTGLGIEAGPDPAEILHVEVRRNIHPFTLREVLVPVFRVLLSPPEEDVPRHNNPTRPLIS